MALIKCGECGKKISEEAYDCPSCGWPNPLARKGPASQKQLDYLRDLGATKKQLKDITMGDASILISKLLESEDTEELESIREKQKAKESGGCFTIIFVIVIIIIALYACYKILN